MATARRAPSSAKALKLLNLAADYLATAKVDVDHLAATTADTDLTHAYRSSAAELARLRAQIVEQAERIQFYARDEQEQS